MQQYLRADSERIIKAAISSVLPDDAVRRALKNEIFPGNIYLVSVGKAAWQMAKTAAEILSQPINQGIVITKYDHIKSPIVNINCFEAGHPVPDENSVIATQAVLDMTASLKENDTVLFLLSGGGSALFEKPLVSMDEMQDITRQLLACGADIVEVNTIRKRLSFVKGGRFAQWCAPARVHSIILSDVLGDPLDMIASGPAAADPFYSDEALNIINKYHLKISTEAEKWLRTETPKELNNVKSQVIGSVRELCKAAAQECEKLGYKPIFLTDQLNCEAREAGRFLAGILKAYYGKEERTVWLAGGETIVHLKGKGLGGRNQELVLAAAMDIDGLDNAAVVSIGSDGTDGPTDAAGGFADGHTASILRDKGIDIYRYLEENDSYHALEAANGLFVTGPTGTNVNDLTLALLN